MVHVLHADRSITLFVRVLFVVKQHIYARYATLASITWMCVLMSAGTSPRAVEHPAVRLMCMHHPHKLRLALAVPGRTVCLAPTHTCMQTRNKHEQHTHHHVHRSHIGTIQSWRILSSCYVMR